VRLVAPVVALTALLAGCGTIISPPPPLAPPAFSQEAMLPGTPVVVAARGARTLQRLSFITRRFGSDSTWGHKSVDSTHVRMRYAQPRSDSTRVFVEYWGRCREGGTACLRALHEVLVLAMGSEEPPPP
jgi:hypothetical protein